MSSKNKGNQKSNQSKEWMENTLLKLMQTEAYEDISIQEITDHAGLSRRTFYRNYSTKDEILEGILYKIWQEYEVSIRTESDLSLPNVAKILFTVMSGHVELLKLLNQHNLLPACLSKIVSLLPPAFYELKGTAMPFDKASISFALAFSMGGFIQILIKWLNEDQQKTPDEMAATMNDILKIAVYPC
jgi:Transcriptional regulator